MAKQSDYVTALLAALADYEKSMDAEGQVLVKAIRELMAGGMKVSAAVETALKQQKYTDALSQSISESVYKMALAGYGISTSIKVDASVKNKITKTLTETPWSSDKMNLSTRLHGTEKSMRQAIVDTIQTSLNKQQCLEKLSMQLYDGYNTGKHVIQPAELPKYLQRLQDSARRVAVGNSSDLKEFNKALAAAKSNMEKITKRNAASTPNTDLMLTYKKLVKEAEKIVKATGKLNTAALDRAVWSAVQEKSRYHADRIARTESARAWFDGFILENQEDDLVWGYHWVLSNRHKFVPFDQCDVCANMDVGYGKGIYPKNKVPSIPRHPHCMCSLEVVYFDEVDTSIPFNPDGARKYLDSLSDEQRKALFDVEGAKTYEQGTDWQKLLRGWGGFENPTSRLNPVFSVLQKAKEESDVYIDPQKTYGIKQKLTMYSLNKDHPKGKDKAIVFESVLGYTKDNWEALQETIFNALAQQAANFSGMTPVTNNKKYTAILPIKGSNERTAMVKTVWELESDGRFRMVNAIVDKKGKNI